MSKPVLNKSYLQKLVDEGLSIKKMHERILDEMRISAVSLTEGMLRKGLKQLGFDLKRKPKEKGVIFVDDTTDNTTFEIPVSEPEVEYSPYTTTGEVEEF